MCGIFGVYNLSGVDEFKAKRSLNAIRHRGPDYERLELVSKSLLFGHVRLSIIDLSEASNQPFSIDNGNYIIVFNGEIYNYLELREMLQKRGVIFFTEGDTEVLLQAYKIYGKECLHLLNGMFSFSIYDRINDYIFCARDRYGVKPFVYSYFGGEFIFCSEIKGILAYNEGVYAPNYRQISDFISHSLGAQSTETWFQDISRLSPGSFMIVSKNGLNIEPYYFYPNKCEYTSFEKAKIKLKELFVDSVKIRMRSDVPVGTTLSSGFDSTAIVSVLRSFYSDSHKTFTAYFDGVIGSTAYYRNGEVLNEKSIVEQLSKDLSLDSDFFKIDNSSYINKLKECIFFLESGHSSPAIVAVDLIYKSSRGKVKVMLDGQGADELMGGYINSVIIDIVFDNLLKGKFLSAFQNIRNFRKDYKLRYALKLYIRQTFPTSLLRFFYRYSIYGRVFKGAQLNNELVFDSSKNVPSEYKFMKRKSFKLHTGVLVDLLHYGDILSMKNGIEGRQPFMDFRIVDFIFKLPPEYLVQNGSGKFIIKEALSDFIPEYVLKNNKKIGFTTPISYLFDVNNPDNALSYFKNSTSLMFFDQKYLEQLIRETNKGKDHSRILFRILSVILWYESYFSKS